MSWKICKKCGIEVTLNLSSNLIGNSNDETNFAHKVSSTNGHVSKICKTWDLLHQLM